MKPADGYYYCECHGADDDESHSLPVGLPVVCKRELSLSLAAAGGGGGDSHSADKQHDAIINSDVMASTDVTTPELLRHRSSWPEDALAERLIHMRSC